MGILALFFLKLHDLALGLFLFINFLIKILICILILFQRKTLKTLLLILHIVFLSTFFCAAQTQFQCTIGGTGDDYATPIIKTNDGGFALAGYTDSYGAGGYDLYVVKLNNNFTIQWSRIIGGTGNDIGLSLVQTTDSGYAVSGETTSFGAGGNDAFIVKLDRNGNLQWIKTFGGADEDYGESIKQTLDGGYILGGYTDSYGAGDFDVYILKLDAAGSIQWSKTIGGPGYDYALSVIQTTDGGYALFGSTNSFGAGYTDYYIIKLDANGLFQWNRTIGGSGGDYGFSIIQTTDGGYALSGTTASFGAGGLDLYIVKTDGTGTMQWSRTIGGTNSEYGYYIIQTIDGGYAVSGSTSSFGAGNADAYIVKLNGNGSLLWSRTVGGANDDNTLSIIQTTDGGYVAAGSTSSFGMGNVDIYIVKLDSNGTTCGNSSSPASELGLGQGTTSTVPVPTITAPVFTVTTPELTSTLGGTVTPICLAGIKSISKNIPDICELYPNYPNPFNSSTGIKFSLPEKSIVKIIIYDESGRKVDELLNMELNGGVYITKWNGDKYASGIYFYQLIAANFNQTRKMILLK